MNKHPNCELGGVSAEIMSGNLFIRKVHLHNKGDIVQGHTHNFDHNTIIFKGAVTVKRGNTVEDFVAPAHLFIDKNIEHEFTALEDGVELWCVYSHRDPQGEVVQEHKGWNNLETIENYK